MVRACVFSRRCDNKSGWLKNRRSLSKRRSFCLVITKHHSNADFHCSLHTLFYFRQYYRFVTTESFAAPSKTHCWDRKKFSPVTVSNEQVRLLILLSSTVEDADAGVVEMGYTTQFLGGPITPSRTIRLRPAWLLMGGRKMYVTHFQLRDLKVATRLSTIPIST